MSELTYAKAVWEISKKASPARLRNGDLGVWVHSDTAPAGGEFVAVTTKTGKTFIAEVVASRKVREGLHLAETCRTVRVRLGA